MANDDDLLKEAIANTETEIFSEAVGKDLPSTEGGLGDRSVEEMGGGLEGQLEADEADPEQVAKDGDEDGGDVDDKAKGDDKAPAKDPKTGQFVKAAEDAKPDDDLSDKTPDGKPKPRVPFSELKIERVARQTAEARIKELETARETERTAAQSELARINQRLDDIIAGRQPRQEAQTEAPEEIDIFSDPDAWKAKTAADIERGLTQKYVAADLARTHEVHGEMFEKAYAALTSLDKNDPSARAMVKQIWDSPTPGAALLKWHGRQEVQRLIGDDPEAYAERVRTEERQKLARDPEYRKQVLTDMQTEARGGDSGTPRHVARMPKSLNSAPGGQTQNGGGGSMDGSDRGVFEDAFR